MQLSFKRYSTEFFVPLPSNTTLAKNGKFFEVGMFFSSHSRFQIIKNTQGLYNRLEFASPFELKPF